MSTQTTGDFTAWSSCEQREHITFCLRVHRLECVPSAFVSAVLRASWFSCHNPSGRVFHGGSSVTEWQKPRDELIPLAKKQNTTHPTHPTHPQPLLHCLPCPSPEPSLPSHSGIKTTFCLATIGVKHFLVSHGQLPESTKLQGGTLKIKKKKKKHVCRSALDI